MEKLTYFKQRINTFDASDMLDCFSFFDKSKKQSLDAKAFDALARSLLTDETGKPNALSIKTSADFFTTFDSNKDRKIDLEEFTCVWKNWITPLIKPIAALLVIDVQNDFTDGSLALRNCPAKYDGREVIPVINNLLQEIKFDAIIYSLDWHPENHISFFENLKYHTLSEKNKKRDIALYDTVTFKGPPEMEQKLWPRHCVKESWGSELHPDLEVVQDSLFVYKGTDSNVDSYSAFWDNMKLSQTKLHEELTKRHVTHLFICGLAMDYCVSFTALDALELGYTTVVIEDATKGTDFENIETMKNKLKSQGCVMASSTEVKYLRYGKNIKTEFACILEKSLRKDSESEDELLF